MSVKAFYALLFAHPADEELAVLLYYYTVVKTLHNDGSTRGGVDDASLAFDDMDIVAHNGIATVVLREQFVKGTPRPDVAPTEFCRRDEDFVSVLHDGIVNGDVFAGGVYLVNLRLLLWGIIDGDEGFELIADIAAIDAKGIDDGGDAPNEDAGVPKVVLLLDVVLGGGQIGLLAEGIDTIDVLMAQSGETQVTTDVAIARCGMGGTDAEGNDGVCLRGKLYGLTDDVAETFDVPDIMVGGGYYDVGAWVAHLDFPRDVTDAGRCAASARFEQDILLRNLGQLLLDKMGKALSGNDPHVLGRYDAGKTIEGELQHGASAA